MTGVELAPPAEGLRWGRRVCAEAVARGVLLRPLGDVVVLMPMLTSTDGEVDRIVTVLGEAIGAVCHRGRPGMTRARPLAAALAALVSRALVGARWPAADRRPRPGTPLPAVGGGRRARRRVRPGGRGHPDPRRLPAQPLGDGPTGAWCWCTAAPGATARPRTSTPRARWWPARAGWPSASTTGWPTRPRTRGPTSCPTCSGRVRWVGAHAAHLRRRPHQDRHAGRLGRRSPGHPGGRAGHGGRRHGPAAGRPRPAGGGEGGGGLVAAHPAGRPGHPARR